MLHLLDFGLTIFHSVLVIFVVLGWIFKATRKLHRWTIGIVLFSWIIIGWYVGTIGFCPLTSWHWELKRHLGESGMSPSFVEYVLEKITGRDWDGQLVDLLTIIGMMFSVIGTAVVIFVDYKKPS